MTNVEQHLTACVCQGDGYVKSRGRGGTVEGHLCECLDRCRCDDDGFIEVVQDGYTFAQRCPVCTIANRSASLVTWAGIPNRYLDADLLGMDMSESGVMTAVDRVVEWLASYELGAPGLTLRGPCGAGKTHLLTAVSWALIRRGVEVRYIDLAEWLRSLRRAMNRGADVSQLRDSVTDSTVLALDELGGVRTEWERQETADLICSRYARELTTLCTTNLPSPQIAEMLGIYGVRVASRLAEMAPEVVVEGADKRRVDS